MGSIAPLLLELTLQRCNLALELALGCASAPHLDGMVAAVLHRFHTSLSSLGGQLAPAPHDGVGVGREQTLGVERPVLLIDVCGDAVLEGLAKALDDVGRLDNITILHGCCLFRHAGCDPPGDLIVLLVHVHAPHPGRGDRAAALLLDLPLEAGAALLNYGGGRGRRHCF